MNNKKYVINIIDRLMSRYDDTYIKTAVLSPHEKEKSLGYITFGILDSGFSIAFTDTIRVVYDYAFSCTDVAKYLASYNCDTTIQNEPVNREPLSIKEIRNLTGLSMKAFAGMYNIPYGTLQKWEVDESSANHRECPVYVRELLERAVKEDFEEEWMTMGNMEKKSRDKKIPNAWS